MKSIATVIFVFSVMSTTAFAQSVETVLTSPLIADYLALDKATGDLYTTNYTQVSRITPDGTITAVASGGFVTGLGVSNAGDLYFADSGAGIIFKRDTNGTVTEFVTGLSDVIGIWMSKDDDGFYAQTYQRPAAVYFVNFDGTVTEIITGLQNRMTDVTVDDDGNIYIAYFDFGRIDRIATDGTLTEFATIPSWLGYMIYHNGHIFATAWQTHEVYRINTSTAEVVLIAGTGVAGLVDGDALTMAQFNEPNGITASVTGDTLYVTDISSNALRRIVGVTPQPVGTEEDVRLGRDFDLGQNFPNPVATMTTIPYSVDRTVFVAITLTDMLGRDIETLVSQTREPGDYTVSWNSSGLSNGVYFYRLQAGSTSETRQFLIAR